LHRSGQRYDTGAPSIFFDAAAVIVSEAQARGLAREAAALDFVSDAFNHLKVIGYVPAAEPLHRRAAIIDELTDAGELRRSLSRSRGSRNSANRPTE
jgi:hypothetical protein